MSENVSDLPSPNEPSAQVDTTKRRGTTRYLRQTVRGPFKVRVKSIDLKQYFNDWTKRDYAPRFQFGWINTPAVYHPKIKADGTVVKGKKIPIAAYASWNLFGSGKIPMRNAYQEIYEAVAGVERGKSHRFLRERPRKVKEEELKKEFGYSSYSSRLKAYNIKFRKQMIKIALRKDNEKLVKDLAESICSLYKNIIDKWQAPKNSPYTIHLKGRNDPLDDKGYMKDSVTYRLKPARK